MHRLAALLLALLVIALPAQAERLTTSLSNEEISITSRFDGEQMTLFGNVEPDVGAAAAPLAGPYHVVIVVEGPLGERVARHKTNQWGIWLNTEQVRFRNFPSFYHVLASGRLADIASPGVLGAERILPAQQALRSSESGWDRSFMFGRELVRLMEQRGLFGLNEGGVQFLSRTAYTARLALPNDVPNGTFITQTYLFSNGEIIARKTERFRVRKTGFERFVATSATQQPLLYGLVCVALALLTGWLGGVVFRR